MIDPAGGSYKLVLGEFFTQDNERFVYVIGGLRAGADEFT
jgi:hypothetical protein